nr:alpha/beta hydrolase [uncultured Albidiferax sp.]
MHTAPLTPAMAGVLHRMARARRTPMHLLTPQQARDAYEIGAAMLEVPKAHLARIDDFTILARDGFAMSARRYAPSFEPLPTLLFFHGGGFMIGSVNTHDILCRELSRLSGCAVVSLGYRMSPEHRFPTAVDDAWDALAWLATQPDCTGVAVGGDSAGGTLAAVCAIQARDAQLPLALQLLFYPGCAAHADTPSHSRFGNGFLLDQSQIQFFFSHYLPHAANYTDWRFAPLNAPDVDGVAPAWFGLAECDPLVDEGVLYADKLRLAGVPVDLDIYRGVTHEFIKMGRAIPEAKLAHQAAAQALRKAFNL